MKTIMTVARALKEKARIITKISESRDVVTQYNTVDLGTRRPLVVKDTIEKIGVLEENLIRIKVALNEANVAIARQLAELMLVRGRISFWAGLDTSDFRTVRNRDESETKITRDVVIGQTEVLTKIEELKNRLNALQDEVDEYNAAHTVEVELL